MCGIVGIINFFGKEVHNPSNIFKMMERQSHRGPDDSGVRICNFKSGCSEEIYIKEVTNNNIGAILGFNRLSIRDITAHGHQPMVRKYMDSTKDVIISFNGEIYNADSIRNDLKENGYSFNGSSDTEVLLNCYIQYGIKKCLELCDGMYSFSIVDLKYKKVYLVRDRVGIKPLYYVKAGEELFYASEIKSFLDLDNLKFTLNKEAITELLIYRCSYLKTLFNEVKQVKPGTYLELELDGTIKEKRYFYIDNFKRNPRKKYDVESVMTEAVKSQMISDVNIGCQLSGGVDSSVVSFIASKNGLSDTESIVFEEEQFSEKKYIDEVSERIKVKSNQYVFTEEDFRKYFEKSIYHLETILNHPNSMGIMKMTLKAKENVSVLLSGEGADELMGGYEWFSIAHNLRKRWRKSNNDEESMTNEFADFVVNYPQVIDTELIQKCYKDATIDKIKKERKSLFLSFTGSLFDRQIKYEMSTYLPEVLLRQDKMSMANSIENRVPILSNSMIEFALQIPEEQLMVSRLRNFRFVVEGKYVFKRLCASCFGKKFAYREKVGFPIPIIKYMKQDYFKNYIYKQVFPKMKSRGILNAEFIVDEYSRFCQGSGNFDLIWRCICFEVWCQLFIDKRCYMDI